MRVKFGAAAIVVGLAGTFALAQPARAALLSLTTSASFTTQVTTNGLALAGSENFESANPLLGGATSVAVNDSLRPGVTNLPFQNGTNVALGMTVQSNTLGANAATTSPFGTGGMLLIVPGFLPGTPSKQIGTNQTANSLDLIFGAGIKAVDLSALFYSGTAASATSSTGTIDWAVFSSSNVLLSSGALSGADFGQGANDFLGFVTTGADTIGRINLFGVGTGNFVGADDISGFVAGKASTGGGTVPEPASLALLGAGLIGLLGARRYRG